MKRTLWILLLLLVPVIALAQTSTVTSTATLPLEDPGSLLPLIRDAFGDKNWTLAAGLVLSALLGLFKLLGLGKLVSKKNTKWLAGVLALVGAVSLGLIVSASWWAIVTTGVGAGVAAVGGWELIFQPIRDFVKKKLGAE